MTIIFECDILVLREVDILNIGNRLKILRKAQGMSQQEFAKRVNLSANFIAQIEMGRKIPSERTINDICHEFNTNYAWLTEGLGEMFKKSRDSDQSLDEGQRIRKIRLSLGLTLEKFGYRIGVKKTSISCIERGVHNVSEHMRKSICREFNVNYDYLAHGTGDMFTEPDIDSSSIKSMRYELFKLLMTATDSEIEVFYRVVTENLEVR